MAETIRRLLGRFTNTTKNPAKFLIIPLVPSGTYEFGDDLASAIETDRPGSVRIGNWSVGIKWEEEVPPDVGVVLHAKPRRGAAVAIRKAARWFGRQELFDVLVGPDDPQTLEAAMAAFESQLLQEAYEEPIEPVPGIARSVEYRAFFRDYDITTNPLLFKSNTEVESDVKAMRCKDMHWVAWLLWKRVQKWHEIGKSPREDQAFLDGHESSVSDDEVKRLSELQRPIYEAHFEDQPATNGAPPILKWDWIAEAFDLFASGNLKDPEGVFNYAPDSQNIFLFAEFAHVALDRAIDTDFWSELRNPLVRAQRLFLDTYVDENTGLLVDPMESAAKLGLDVVQQLHDAYEYFGGAALTEQLLWNIKSGYKAGMTWLEICPEVGDL